MKTSPFFFRSGLMLAAAFFAPSGIVRADQTLAGNITIGGTLDVQGNATTTIGGSLDVLGNTTTFGRSAPSSTTPALTLAYKNDGVDTLTLYLNRNPASFRWGHPGNSTEATAMRLTSAHELLLYKADGTTGLALTPAGSMISLGNATLYEAEAGVLRTNGALKVDGALTAPSFVSSSGALAGGSSGGLTLNAGGSGDQNITLNPTDEGYILLQGNVGLGTSTPSEKLSVVGNLAVTGHAALGGAAVVDGSALLSNATTRSVLSLRESPTELTTSVYNGIMNSLVLNSSADSSTFVTGLDNTVHTEATNTKNYGALIGFNAAIQHNGSGAIPGGILANQFIATNGGNGSVPNVTGIDAAATNFSSAGSTAVIAAKLTATYNSTGTVTNLRTLAILSRNQGTGTVTNSKGIDYNNFTNNGTITNTYGVYIGNLTGGTQTNRPYSYYAADSNAYNYFAGNVGIGAAIPSEKLEVNGNAKIAGTVKVTGAVLVPEQGDLPMGDFHSGPTPTTP